MPSPGPLLRKPNPTPKPDLPQKPNATTFLKANNAKLTKNVQESYQLNSNHTNSANEQSKLTNRQKEILTSGMNKSMTKGLEAQAPKLLGKSDRSELNLPHANKTIPRTPGGGGARTNGCTTGIMTTSTSTPRLNSPSRRSALPVPKSTPSPSSSSPSCSSSPNAKKPSGSPTTTITNNTNGTVVMRNKRPNHPNRLRNSSHSPSRSPRNSISSQSHSSPVSSPRNSMYKDTLVMNSLNNIANASDSSANSQPVVNAKSVGVPKQEGENDTDSNSQKKQTSKNTESGKLVAGSSPKGSMLKSSPGASKIDTDLSSAKSEGRTRTKSSLLPQRNSTSSESHLTKPQKSVTISEPMYDHPKPVVAVVDPVNSTKNTLEEDFTPQASPPPPSNGSLSKSSSGQRSRIPTSPPSPTSNSGVNNSKPDQDRGAPLPKSSNKPLASKKMMANINGTQVKLIQSPKNKSRHHHFSQLVSAGHLNKSTPNSLNTVGKVNLRGKASAGTAKPTSKSRPTSREFDSFVGKVSSASSLGSVEAKNHLVNLNPRVKKATERVPSMGSLQPMAPKAKFRSDGEISICGSSDPQSSRVQAQPSLKGDLIGIEQEHKNPAMPSESTGRESPEHVAEAAVPNNLATHMDTKTCDGEPTRQSILSTPKRPPRTLSTGGAHSSKAVAANIPSSSNSRTSSSTSASATVSGTIPQSERGQNEHHHPPPRPSTCTLDKSSRTGKGIEKNGGKNSRGNNATPGSGARIPPTTTTYSSVEQNPRSSADVQCWPWALQQPTNESRTSSVHISESCFKSRKDAEIDTNHSQVKGLRDPLKSDSACKNLERHPPSRKSRRRDNIKSKNNINNTSNGNIVKQHSQNTAANGSVNSKSVTLDCDIERGGFFKARSRSLTFFQRLGGLRRSLSRSLGLNPTSSPSCSGTRAPAQTKDPLALSKDVNHLSNQPLRDNPSNEDRDWVFFRGFSGKRREDLIEPYAVCHGPVLAIQSSNPFPQAPPRRKRPRRQQLISDEQSRETSHLLRVVDTLNPLRRSLSFTDAHFIAQAVYEGDTKLIEELYPDFPLSTPIYAVIDKSKKNHTRKLSQRPTSEIHTITPSLSVGAAVHSNSKKAGAIAKTHNNDQTRQILSSRSSPGPRDPPSSQAHSPSSSEKHHHHHHLFVQDRKCHPQERNSLATAGQEGVATFISPTSTPVVDGREFEHSDRISGPSRRVIVSLSNSTNLIATPNNSSAQDNPNHQPNNNNSNNKSICNVMKGIDVLRSTASTSSLTTTTTTTNTTTITNARGFRRSPGSPAFCSPSDHSDSLPVPQPLKKGVSSSRHRKLSNSSANNEQFLLNNSHSNEQVTVAASPRLSHNTHYRQLQPQHQEQKVVKSRNHHHHNGSTRLDNDGDRVDDNNVTFSCPVMFVKQDDPRAPHLSVETSSSHFTSVDHQSDLDPPQTPPLPPLRMDLFDHEPSLVISPWNTHQHGRPGSTSSNESSSGCSSGNGNAHLQLIDPDEWHTTVSALPTHLQPMERPQPHPFAQRAHTHYSQRQNQRQNQLLSDERERFQATLSNSDGGTGRAPSGGRCVTIGSDMQQDVSITTSRRNGSGGVTLSPGTLTGSHELNINGDTRHNGHLIYNNVSHLKGHNRMASPRYMRSESADRLLDNERLLRRQDKNQSKKISAPAFGTAAHPREALASFHHISPRDHSMKVEDLSNGNSKFDLDDSFRHILAKADNSISQAESILSSLRVESHAEIPRLMDHEGHGDLDDDEDHDDDDANHHNQDDDSDPEQPHLGSDIETNIRRLEKTQAKINAALKTFRTVQALSDNTNIIRSHFRPRASLDQHPFTNFHQSNLSNDESQSSKAGSAFQSLPHRIDGLSRSHSLPQGDAAHRSDKALTAPANMESAATAAAQAPLVATHQSTTSKGSLHPIVEPNTHEGVAKGRKTSLFRRHSFSLIANKEKEKSPASECSSTLDSGSSQQGSSTLWYEGDLESEAGQKSSGHLYDESHSYSDSEGGFLPLRHRLRGLLGSFGKGKKKIPRSGSGKRRIRVEHIGPIEVKHAHDQNSPVLKAQLGEFTRQIESLSNGRDSPANVIGARPSIDTNPQDKEHHHHHQCQVISGGATASTKSIILRPKRELVKNDSVDTYASCESSFNGNSNRNSVISGQSVSSESFGQEDHSVSDDDRRGGDGHSSPRSHHDDLTPAQRHEKKVYYIAREIMTSERVFVDILRLLNVEFREFVQHARRESKSGIMPDTDFSRLFSNLPELQTLNEDLLQDFEDRVENWDTQKKIADVIVKKGPFLKLYTTYIREFSTVNYHFDECCQKYPKFGKLVKEFEAKERCRNLKIKHFMLKPVQRLPQYRLLLEDYLKHLDPQSPDFDDTTNALHIVSEAADHANDTIKQGDKFRRMLKLQSRLGDLELIRPGRELIREGELQKISRKGIGPRYFVLLSDCLLYCTYSGSWTGDSTNLRVSYKIPLTALQVRVPNYDDYQNEFYITSPVRSCTLRSSSVHERNDWLDALNSAIEDHVSRKATFHAVNGQQDNLQFISPDEAGKIGNSAPVWIPDRRVTMCQNCAVEFSVLVRRHHCRACGKVICATCSANKAPLRYREFEAARVCDECFDFLERELIDFGYLKSRFKKRDTSKHLNRYVPQRLKVSANGQGAQMCGYLKRRMKNSKWKRMWFVLKDRVLYAYKASEDSVAADTFPILGYDLDTLSEKNFELYEGEYAGLVFILSHPGGESLVFCAENDNICEKWISALREAVHFDLEDSIHNNEQPLPHPSQSPKQQQRQQKLDG